MPRYPHVKTSDLITLYTSGKSAGEIAAIVGMTEAGVYVRLKSAGTKCRTLKERFPKAFPPVRKLVAMYKAGQSCVEIGDRLGLSYMTVSKRLRSAGVAIRPAGSGHTGKFVAGKSPMWK